MRHAQMLAFLPIFAALPVGAQPLPTIFAGGGQAAGLMFDLVASQSGTAPTHGYFSILLGAGQPYSARVWFREGSYVGHESDPTDWTLSVVTNGLSGGSSGLIDLFMPPLQAGVPRGVFVEFTSQPNAVMVYTPIPPASASYANSVATLNGGAAKGSGGFAGITTQGAMVNATLYFSTCPANCDASTIGPFLNVMDFVCFYNRFAAGHILANCDRSTTPPVLNVIDFVCFVNAFVAGCSAP